MWHWQPVGLEQVRHLASQIKGEGGEAKSFCIVILSMTHACLETALELSKLLPGCDPSILHTHVRIDDGSRPSVFEGFPNVAFEPFALLPSMEHSEHHHDQRSSYSQPLSSTVDSEDSLRSFAHDLLRLSPLLLSGLVLVGEKDTMRLVSDEWGYDQAVMEEEAEGNIDDYAAWARYEVVEGGEGSLLSLPRMSRPFQGPYNFRYNWCSGHGKIWDGFFGELVHSGRAVRVLEIGSWEGRSALYWLKKVCSHVDSRLTLVDHFDNNERAGRERRRMLEYNLHLTGDEKKVEVLPYFSFEALTKHILPSATTFDVIYIDGDHAAKHTLEDALLSWKALKRGGFLLFDDYLWPPDPEGKDPLRAPFSFEHPLHPKRGIDAFLSIMAEELEVKWSGYQVLVQKKTEPCFNFPVDKQRIPVVMAFDESYIKPAAVAIKSMVDHCSRPHDLHLLVVDLGISGEAKALLERLASIHWIDGVKGGLEWAKLYMHRELPKWSRRYIYIDADILVTGDICELWGQPLYGRLAAVRDMGYPNGHKGIPGWQEPGSRYFNAGVFMFNLHDYQKACEALIPLIHDHKWRYGDQDLLNQGFKDDWQELPLAWNVQGIDSYINYQEASISQPQGILPHQLLEELKTAPKIVHFSGGGSRLGVAELCNRWVSCPVKPWSGLSQSHWACEWFRVLDSTPWEGWRPNKEEVLTHLQGQLAAYVDSHWMDNGSTPPSSSFE